MCEKRLRPRTRRRHSRTDTGGARGPTRRTRFDGPSPGCSDARRRPGARAGVAAEGVRKSATRPRRRVRTGPAREGLNPSASPRPRTGLRWVLGVPGAPPAYLDDLAEGALADGAEEDEVLERRLERVALRALGDRALEGRVPGTAGAMTTATGARGRAAGTASRGRRRGRRAVGRGGVARCVHDDFADVACDGRVLAAFAGLLLRWLVAHPERW